MISLIQYQVTKIISFKKQTNKKEKTYRQKYLYRTFISK